MKKDKQANRPLADDKHSSSLDIGTRPSSKPRHQINPKTSHELNKPIQVKEKSGEVASSVIVMRLYDR